MRGGVVAATDAVLRHEAQHVAVNVVSDAHCRTRHLCVIRIRCHSHRGINHCSIGLLGIVQSLSATTHHWRIIAGANGDGAGFHNA